MSTNKFSLLNVCRAHEDGTVDGYWVRDHIGTAAGAMEKARRISELNPGLHVVVVEYLNCPTPMLNFWTGRRVVRA